MGPTEQALVPSSHVHYTIICIHIHTMLRLYQGNNNNKNMCPRNVLNYRVKYKVSTSVIN